MLLGDQNTCHALPGPPWIVHKGRFHVCHFLVAFTGYEMMRGFLKGVSEEELANISYDNTLKMFNLS